jgi:hypothetical protein
MPTVSVVDGAGLGEIGELGARVASPRELAVELGKNDDRDGEQAGEFLEAAGDQGDLQPALLDLDAGGDELQVVHDQEGEVGMLCLERGLQIARSRSTRPVESSR